MFNRTCQDRIYVLLEKFLECFWCDFSEDHLSCQTNFNVLCYLHLQIVLFFYASALAVKIQFTKPPHQPHDLKRRYGFKVSNTYVAMFIYTSNITHNYIHQLSPDRNGIQRVPTYFGHFQHLEIHPPV